MEKHRLERIEQVRKEEEVSALLIVSSENRYYASGFRGTAGMVLFTQQNRYLLVDFRYREQAEKQTTGFQLVEVKDDFTTALEKVLVKEKIADLGFAASKISYKKYRNFCDKLPAELIPLDDPIDKLRRIKDKQEIEYLEKAAGIADRAFEHILSYLSPGRSEREISLELEYFMKKNGGEKNSFDFIVASGQRSALPHGIAEKRKLRSGDFVTMDFGTICRGYCSDITRTVVLGSAESWQEEIYGLVNQARAAAIRDIRPGMTGKEADNLAREIISEGGYGDCFGHGLGHGLGLEVHEQPRLSRKSDTVLKPGMVFTCEPGIYLPGRGGVRIEDDLLLTEQGCRVLSSSTRELLII
ncbi:MAG: M24 family metallopeptidase [Halanaerobiaceae bacterium]